jgi:hypothetical protein
MTQPQQLPVAPPMMEALAALRCWAVEIELAQADGQMQWFRIEPAPAADWLIATLELGHLSYLPGMLDDEQRDRMMEALNEGQLTSKQLVEANREAIEVVSGWPWWQAGRLIGVLSHGWARLGGMLSAQGIDPQVHSLGKVLGGVYSLLYNNTTSKEDREKFLNALLMPPQVDMPEGEWDDDAAHEALWQMMAARAQAGAT